MIDWEDIKKYSPTDRGRLRWWLIVSGLLLTLTGNTQMEARFFYTGIVMMVPGMILHLISKGHLHQNKILTRTGPYRWVRNPFYLANALIDFGICMVINRWELTVIYGLFWIIAYGRQIKMEEEFLEDKFGDDFRDYRKKVPSLIPYKPPIDPEGQETKFSWQNENLSEGKEASRLFRYASYPFLLFAAEKFGHWGADVFSTSWMQPVFFASFIGFLLLYWFSLASKTVVKKRSHTFPDWLKGKIARVSFGVLLILILLVSDAIPFSVGKITFTMSLLISIPLLALLQILFFGLRSEEIWFSYRFRRILECLFYMILCIVGQIPWLIFLPLFYYGPMIMYGNNGESEPEIEHLFTKNDNSPLKSFLSLKLLLFTGGFAILLLKQIYVMIYM